MSIVLNDTDKKLEILLGGAVAANELPFTSSYADYVDGTPSFTPGANDGVTNGATPVELVGVPGASTQRLVNNISIYNKDTSAVEVTIQYEHGADHREIVKVDLAVSYSLHFREDQWQILNTTGCIQMSMGGSVFADGEGDPATIEPDNAAVDGVSAYAARRDHQHQFTCAVAVNTGTTNAEGAASTSARSDHVHALHNHLHAGVAGDGGQFSHASLTNLVAPADDHTQYLLADGSRNLGGNLGVDAVVTIDGVDVSEHNHSGAGQGGTVGFDSLSGDCDLADLAGYVRGSIIRGGVADWEAHAALTDHFILIGDATDIVSKAFDWDDVAAGAGADMVHDHSVALEGGEIPLASMGGYTQGDLIYGGAADWQDLAHPGVANRVLQSSAAEIAWSANAVTFPAAGAVPVGTGQLNRVAYWTGANTLANNNNLMVDSINGLYMVTKAGGGIGYNSTTARLLFDTSGAVDYAYFMSCNVGVGTATPAVRAEVYGGAENNTTLGAAVAAALRISNIYSAAYGRLSELQFQGPNDSLVMAVVAGQYSNSAGGPIYGGDLIFASRITATNTITEGMRLNYLGKIVIASLAGVGNRNVVADANGVLSAP